MGAGGGAQSCACGGCRWVTHPHRSLLHQFWWGKAPLIGFVENDLPPWRSGRNAAHGLTGGTGYPGGCLLRAKPAAAGCLPSPRSTRPPAHRAALPAAARPGCFALESVAAAAPCWQRWARCPQRPAPCRRFLLAAVAALPIDAARMRFGSGEGCKSPRGLAPPPDGSGVKWNFFDCGRGLLASASLVLLPLFHLTPLPPAARGRLSVLAKAKPVFHGSARKQYQARKSILFAATKLCALPKQTLFNPPVANPESGNQRDSRVVGRKSAGGKHGLEGFRLRNRAAVKGTRGLAVIPRRSPALGRCGWRQSRQCRTWPHPLNKRIFTACRPR